MDEDDHKIMTVSSNADINKDITMHTNLNTSIDRI